MDRHVLAIHTEKNIPVKNEQDENGRFKCSFCNKTFSFKSCAKKHEKIHTGEGFVSCGQCNKVFRTNNQLKVHELGIHSGLKAHYILLGQ